MDTTQAISAYDAIAQKAADIQSQGMYGDEAMIAGAAELATYFSDTTAILSMMDTLTNYAAGMSNGEALDAGSHVFLNISKSVVELSNKAQGRVAHSLIQSGPALINDTLNDGGGLHLPAQVRIFSAQSVYNLLFCCSALNDGGFGFLTGNTAAASAAVFTFNSALMASPITWVILAIIALIAIIYAAVGAVNHFAGTSVSATGIITGAFAVLGAHVLNGTVIPLYNGFASFGEAIKAELNVNTAAEAAAVLPVKMPKPMERKLTTA